MSEVTAARIEPTAGAQIDLPPNIDDVPDTVAEVLEEAAGGPGHGGLPALYLASPLGFTEAGLAWSAQVLVPAVTAAGWRVLDPWDDPDDVIGAALAVEGAVARHEALRAANDLVGARNQHLLEEAHCVLALLDGAEIDAGTAAEVGWSAARGTPVIGLRTDLRRSGDNEAAPVNLQVLWFLHVSGGTLTTTLTEALAALERHRPTGTS